MTLEKSSRKCINKELFCTQLCCWCNIKWKNYDLLYILSRICFLIYSIILRTILTPLEHSIFYFTVTFFFSIIVCNYVLATDIVFLMDTSSGVGEANFAKMKDFVKNIIRSFDVDNKLTRVSVITFDRDAKLVIKLLDHNSMSPLLANLASIPYSSGPHTRMDKALLLAHSEAFTEKNGARDGVNRVCVVF